MFKILCMLRDLNKLRHITWTLDEEEGVLAVRIPLNDDDIKFVKDMQRLFEPV